MAKEVSSKMHFPSKQRKVRHILETFSGKLVNYIQPYSEIPTLTLEENVMEEGVCHDSNS